MRFLVDAQLPPALVRLLVELGHRAEHVTEIGPADAADRAIWQFALEPDAVIVTKDEDFSRMAAVDGDAPAVVWVRTGNTRRLALLAWFAPLVGRVVELVDAGERVVELR